MADAAYIASRVAAAKAAHRARDTNHARIIAMREGDYEKVAPGLFQSQDFGQPLVANLIDTAARDVAEVMAPLPSFNCLSASLSSEADQKRQDLRAAIANSYVQSSRLQVQRYAGTDRYGSFGVMVYVVEPDFDEQAPVIRISENHSAYYTTDHLGRVQQYMEPYYAKACDIHLEYPDLDLEAAFFRRFGSEWREKWVEVCRWKDRHEDTLVLTEEKVVLASVPNRVGKCLVFPVERPTITGGAPRGQFDDVLWVQIARAMLQMYTMEAIDQSVNAPIVAPEDVQEIPLGPQAVLKTANPGGVGRVNLAISPGLFPQMAALQAEQLQGSRYPEGRSGSIDASIITGQGVEALMGTFNTQVNTFQRLDAAALEDVLAACFLLDETYWPDVKKTRRLKDNGAPREVIYTPAKDIAGNHMVDVTYGAIAGLDPNRALVFLLQGLAGGLFAKATARKYLPVDLNVVAEERQIQLEQLNDSIASSMSQLALAIPQMAMQGMDPREIVLQLAQAEDLIQKGKEPADVIREVFAPKEQPQEAAPTDPMAALTQGGGGAGLPGEGSGGASDLLMMMSGLTAGGSPNLQANVSRYQEI